MNKEFEREVRVPYPLFKDIVNRVRDQPWTRHKEEDGQRGRPSVMPIEFKVLMTLYRLGAGCLSHTVVKLFLMVITTGDTFFKDFCEFYAKRYHECCNVTETEPEQKHVEKVYSRMGLHGVCRELY